ncbi:hypothetical protein ES703_63029 [subsurface metagenome]
MGGKNSASSNIRGIGVGARLTPPGKGRKTIGQGMKRGLGSNIIDEPEKLRGGGQGSTVIGVTFRVTLISSRGGPSAIA